MADETRIKKKIDDLRAKIRHHEKLYYIDSDPEISDREYDELIEELARLEEQRPQFKDSSSPTQRIFPGISGSFATVLHRERMLSLDNTYSDVELRQWEERAVKALGTDVPLRYMAELKIDGVSCSLLYKQGKLMLGATRGDGERGEDVTVNIRTIRTIPLVLSGVNIPQLLEARGEVYMEKSDLAKINEERLRQSEPPFANPRNAASGSLKLLDPDVVRRRNLKCFIHSCGRMEPKSFDSQRAFLAAAKGWGLRVNVHNTYCENLDQVLAYFERWKKTRQTLEYEVDGVVVKIDAAALQKRLGQTAKSPRWAVAYKFPAHQATTIINKVEFGVGRTGIITPVALLVPVSCGGVTISRATLHNFDEIKRLDIRIGDTVLIERAGEVIPKIVKVIAARREKNSRPIHVPRVCPICRSSIVKEKEDEVYWYCVNPDCPARLKNSLLHFASRAAMDIEGMGESLVTELTNRGLVKGIADIYRLKVSDFIALPLFKEKRAVNVHAAIQKSKQAPLSRFLFGLGIRHIGEKAARTLAQQYGSIDVFFGLTRDDYSRIPEIGTIMADSLVTFFSRPRTKKMIMDFKKSGLALVEGKVPFKTDTLSGKKFVFTGELESLSRAAARQVVEEHGGAWLSSLSKHIDFVVVGKNPGSKAAKAKKLGVALLTEQDFLRLVTARG